MVGMTSSQTAADKKSGNFRKSIINSNFFTWNNMYYIHYCFICRPSESTVSEDAGSEPRNVTTLALAVLRCNQFKKLTVTLGFYILFILWWVHTVCVGRGLIVSMSSRRNHGAILSRLIRVILPCAHVLGPNGMLTHFCCWINSFLQAQILISNF